MIQIRIHGRGGQGVVTAAELIALAAFNDGLYAQAFPAFGVERSGAPIQAFVRLDTQPIITREQIYRPDILIIQDESLLLDQSVLSGINTNTKLIVNSSQTPTAISRLLKKRLSANQIITNPATSIALELLGKNLVNTVILGAFTQATAVITIKSLQSAITAKFKDKGQEIIHKNHAAVLAAYRYVRQPS